MELDSEPDADSEFDHFGVSLYADYILMDVDGILMDIDTADRLCFVVCFLFHSASFSLHFSFDFSYFITSDVVTGDPLKMKLDAFCRTLPHF